MATEELSHPSHLKMDHVPSVPVDLRQMSATNMTNKSIHRTAGLMSLNATGSDESGSRISESADEPRETSDDANTSELAKDVGLLYDLIDEKDAETKKLKHDVKELQQHCNEIQGYLDEAQMIIAEQQEQLQVFRQEIAVSKSNIEALKCRNYVLASNSSGATEEVRKMVEEYREMQEELERLRHERKTMDMEMTRLKKQDSFLRRRAREEGARQESRNGTGGAVEAIRMQTSSSRSQPQQPRELPADTAVLIRQLRKEKQHWEEYANRLVRAMVESGLSPEDLLETDGCAPTKATSEGADRWRTYALRLLSDIVRWDPSRLSEFDRRLLRQHRSGDGDLEAPQNNVLNSTTHGRGSEPMPLQASSSVSPIHSGEKQTRANFSQTRRRKIDRLKQFFHRR